MSLSEKQRKFTRMIGDLIRYAYENGCELTFGEALRTPEQQALYIKQGKSKTSVSKHLERLAVDFNLFVNNEYKSDAESYKLLGEFWEKIGGVWGGRFGDNPATKQIEGWDANHFEYGER